MTVRGRVYHHKHFKFHDGESGQKRIILLNTPKADEPYLFVKTTSQDFKKPFTPGCNKRRALFFIKANTTIFELNTWVQLYELYPMDSFEEKPPLIKLIGDLSENLIHKIIKCLVECQPDDLSQYFEKLLSKEVTKTKTEKAIEQLKSKWNKRL